MKAEKTDWETVMEFHEKLQQLRKQKGLTQEALAEQLYVSRTAVSKWESGRGYPNIESLKAIARFYAVSLDELLSSGEVLVIAEENQRQIKTHDRTTVFGLLDMGMLLLFVLPMFAEKQEGAIRAASLLTLDSTPLYLKITYFAVVIGMGITGILTLALQNRTSPITDRTKLLTWLSIVLGVVSVLCFVVSTQPYAAVFAFSQLAVKAILLIKNR